MEAIEAINQNIMNEWMDEANPLFTNRLRVLLREQEKLVKKNIHEEEKEWVKSTATAMGALPQEKEVTQEIARDIWATDEQAINTFMSVCRRQINEAIIPPSSLIILRERDILGANKRGEILSLSLIHI